jgi:hypothetical protein
MTERISVKDHYRVVTRDSKGRFAHVRKWQGSKKRILCCCCGLFPAIEANGLCKDCAAHCAGYILKDKPCQTIEVITA